MASYLITGSPGSGKSTIIAALHNLGFAAYDTDEMPEVTRLEYKATGMPAAWPQPPIDWNVYGWHWRADGLKKLLQSADPVFVGAIVTNQEQFEPLFSKVFVLTLNSQMLAERLQSRQKAFGKQKDEFERLVSKHETRQSSLLNRSPHAIAIDNSRPITEVVTDILQRVRTT